VLSWQRKEADFLPAFDAFLRIAFYGVGAIFRMVLMKSKEF
jgi:hypothetical protein